jgi:SAM-dependent methyltransferase
VSDGTRQPQLAYSDGMAKMLDEQHRRAKARKILAVLHHYLGRDDLAGLIALDIGCSAGFIADELAHDGADTIGVDIDEPGLAAAQRSFGRQVRFVLTSGDALPFPDDALDVVVFNHIYEHVVDPDAVLTEIHRVLKPAGVAYLGLGNKYQVMEPHYRLPFLSWLPQRAADSYVRQGRGLLRDLRLQGRVEDARSWLPRLGLHGSRCPAAGPVRERRPGARMGRASPTRSRPCGDADHPHLHLGGDQDLQPALDHDRVRGDRASRSDRTRKTPTTVKRAGAKAKVGCRNGHAAGYDRGLPLPNR